LTILQTLQTVSANADVATTHTELRRRFQESVRSALPRSGGITGWELEHYLTAVIAPVIGDLVRELRSADAKLTEHVKHLRRLLVLRDAERHVLETADRKMRVLIDGHEKRLRYLELVERKNRRT
jgi:hypothetical protein